MGPQDLSAEPGVRARRRQWAFKEVTLSLLSSFCGPGLRLTLPQEALCSLGGLGSRGTCRKSAGVWGRESQWHCKHDWKQFTPECETLPRGLCQFFHPWLHRQSQLSHCLQLCVSVPSPSLRTRLLGYPMAKPDWPSVYNSYSQSVGLSPSETL